MKNKKSPEEESQEASEDFKKSPEEESQEASEDFKKSSEEHRKDYYLNNDNLMLSIDNKILTY